MGKFFLRRLRESRSMRRIFLERLTEPVHLNLLSGFIALFGNFRAKIDFDLVVRQHTAFGLLKAADYAKDLGISCVTAIEFGVANGGGLLNMCEIGKKITGMTGVSFDIVGFDTGQGMPPPRDYRDHPEYFSQGDYPMENKELLVSKLPENARIEFGAFADTVERFLSVVRNPIGFISVDVDYYFSTVDALTIFEGSSDHYLPMVVMYFDDICLEGHNQYCGELLAIDEFNYCHDQRKITKFNFLKQSRIFRNPNWINQMYLCHIFDHTVRQNALKAQRGKILTNPYL